MVTTQVDNPTGGLLGRLQIPNSRAELSVDTIVMSAGGILIPLGLARLFASAPLGVFSADLNPGPIPLFLAAFFTMGLASILLFVSQLEVLRPAGLAAIATGSGLFAESISRIGDSPKGGIGITIFVILSLMLFVFPLTRHPFFLGVVLYSGWRLLALLTSDLGVRTFAGGLDPRADSDLSSATLALSVLLAAIYLGAVWFLDRKNAQGLAVPFAAVGIIVATAVVASNPNFLISLWAFGLAGAAVWVGVSLRRRGVAWAGAFGLVLAMFRLYDGFGSRFAGLVAILVGVGLLIYAGRSLLPGAAKAVNGIASNKAVLPNGAQLGPAHPSTDYIDLTGNAPQGSGGSNPGSIQPGNAPQGSGGSNPGFVQPVGGHDNQRSDSDQIGLTSSDNAELDGQIEPVQPTPTREYQRPTSVEDLRIGQTSPIDVNDATNKQTHATDQIEAVTERYAPAVAEETVSENSGAPVMEPNWYADPTERYDHRWHDGVNWTEHVATAGNSAVDPIS